MSTQPVRFGIVGVGGFAQQHLAAIAALEQSGLAQLVAVTSRNPSAVEPALSRFGLKMPTVYADYQSLLDKADVDALCVPTPMHLHCEITLHALERGRAVFLEKPPVTSLDQWNQVAGALRRTGLPCQVCFQTLSGKHVRDLKEWIIRGRLGEIRAVVAYSHQKRYDSYYSRSDWAGKIRLGNHLVRDGSVNNPMGHQLHNALYFACAEPCEWADTVRVRAELYRGHPIETEDTTSLEIFTRQGPRVYFYTTLCSQHHSNLTGWRVEGSEATALLDLQTLQLQREGRTLETIPYRTGDHGTVTAMMENFIRFLQGRDDRLICPFEKTRSFTAAVEGMFLSSEQVHAVPPPYIERHPVENSVATEIKDIDSILQQAAREKRLLSDLGVPWAVPSRTVNVAPAS